MTDLIRALSLLVLAFVVTSWVGFLCYVLFEVIRGVLSAPGPFPVFLPPRG